MCGACASRAGGTCLSHMIVSKKLDFTLTYFLCILHSLNAGWCAIFTHRNHPESSRDISAVGIGVSRIQNTTMPRIHWFFFNALRTSLTHGEDVGTYTDIWDSTCNTLLYPQELCHLITVKLHFGLYIEINCWMKPKQTIKTSKREYRVVPYRLSLVILSEKGKMPC